MDINKWRKIKRSGNFRRKVNAKLRESYQEQNKKNHVSTLEVQKPNTSNLEQKRHATVQIET